jgi:hypothetical protein
VKEPVYIHFDFDEFRPWLMNKEMKEDEDGNWVFWTMLPPGRTTYFYSLGGEDGQATAARDQLVSKRKIPKIVKNIKFTELEGENAEKVIKFEKTLIADKVNFIIGSKKQLLNSHMIPQNVSVIVPRP